MDAIQYFKRAPSALTITPTISPFTYTNASAGIELVTILGGVVAKIELNKGAGYVTQVGIAGVFQLNPTDSLRVTYTIAPAMTGLQL